MRVRALAFGLCLAGSAAAAEPQPYRVEYSAPAGCSSREAFVRELVARTALVRVAGDGDQVATYAVTLSTEPSGMFGELVLRERDGRATHRALRGKTCDEVVGALAFIAAILVDPEALARPRADTAPLPPAAAASVGAAGSGEREPPSARGTGFHLGASAGASLETSISPDPAFGAFGEVLVERRTAEERGLSFGAAFHVARGPHVQTRAGRADFTWMAGRGWFCPLALPSRGIFSFVPCGEVEVGTLKVEGSETINRKTVVRPWLAFGPLARLELRPTRFLALMLDGMAVFTPLSHPSFYFSPDIEVFSVPVVGFASRAGIRAILP